MRFKDSKVKRFVSHMRLFLDDENIYELETMNMARDGTIYINGVKEGALVSLEIVRLKFAPAELIIKDVGFHKDEIMLLWKEVTDRKY